MTNVISDDQHRIIQQQGERLIALTAEVEQLKRRLALVESVEKWIRGCPLEQFFYAGLLNEFR